MRAMLEACRKSPCRSTSCIHGMLGLCPVLLSQSSLCSEWLIYHAMTGDPHVGYRIYVQHFSVGAVLARNRDVPCDLLAHANYWASRIRPDEYLRSDSDCHHLGSCQRGP